ncbi:hypothetical protein ASD11_14015 [Aeromicrobium sp. Root495]|nr:hypothetical protein ASD11_14015 [Aeromicrobium sp. Root495]
MVKKVVKKAVVRPTAPAAASRTTTTQRPKATAVSRVTKPVKRPVPAQPAKPTRSVDVGAGVSRAAGATKNGVLRAWHSALDAGWAVRDRSANGVDAVLDYRLPQQPPMRAAAISGAVAGLVAVALGALVGMLFTELRGTTSGGGFWGSVAFLVTMVIAVVLGARLAALLGCPSGLVVSFLGTVFTIVVILMFFLDLSQGPWAFLLVPALAVVGFAGAVRLVEMAEQPTQA